MRLNSHAGLLRYDTDTPRRRTPVLVTAARTPGKPALAAMTCIQPALCGGTHACSSR